MQAPEIEMKLPEMIVFSPDVEILIDEKENKNLKKSLNPPKNIIFGHKNKKSGELVGIKIIDVSPTNEREIKMTLEMLEMLGKLKDFKDKSDFLTYYGYTIVDDKCYIYFSMILDKIIKPIYEAGITFSLDGGVYMIGKKVLGKGSFGEVRLGIGLQNGSSELIKCAIKIMDASSPDCKREIEVLKLLNNKVDCEADFLCYYGDAIVGKKSYIFMEYVSGVDLLNYVEENELTIGMMRDCIQALKKLHEKRFVHRDIKPDNIMIQTDKDNKIKYLDWGGIL